MNKATLLQKKQFAFEYERLCVLQNTCPLPIITANLKREVIDFNADCLRLNEWEPLLGAISVNDSLRYVAVRSYWQPDTNGKSSCVYKFIVGLCSNFLET